jgi:hypothetical protein
MTEDGMHESLVELAREYRRPPETPREEIWAALQPALAVHRRPRRRVWWGSAAGMAATFLLGIAMGGGLRGAGDPEMVTPAPVAAVDLETGRHLMQVDLLLRGVRTDAASGTITAGRAEAARLLLAENRLLTDLPPAEHLPEVARLLGDIELVLAQIAVMAGGTDAEELRLVDEGIEARDVIPRLQQLALHL